MGRDYQIFDTDVQGVSVTIYPTGYRARTLRYRAVGRHRPMPGEPSTGTCHGQLQAVMPVDLQFWRARGKQPLQANVRKGPRTPCCSAVEGAALPVVRSEFKHFRPGPKQPFRGARISLKFALSDYVSCNGEAERLVPWIARLDWCSRRETNVTAKAAGDATSMTAAAAIVTKS